MPSENIQRASQYLALASAYAGAARRVLATEIAGNERLPYFALVAHGLELALKAILTRAGWDEERLMLIGHDLERCYVAVSRYRADLTVIVNRRGMLTPDRHPTLTPLQRVCRWA